MRVDRHKRADELYELGDLPEPGETPTEMYASVIRRERYGDPLSAFCTEVVPVPAVPPGHVLVAIMAAGINYNNVWAARGNPADVITSRERSGDTTPFHIGGSEGSGIVWELGDGVSSVDVGDEVILSGCSWDFNDPAVRLGMEPMLSRTQKVWGYERNWGAFAQFALVADFQCHPKPLRLSWEDAAGFLLTGATAYRQLTGWPPHVVKPGDSVLIWGGAGGLGSMATQLVRWMGGLPVCVVSNTAKSLHCADLGAVGVIDRTKYDHWGPPPPDSTKEQRRWRGEVARFAAEFAAFVPQAPQPAIVFEHSGADTFPTSILLCAAGGMVVDCGATSGFEAQVDLRYVWMKQKRIQGSHFASLRECRAVINLVQLELLKPCVNTIYEFEEIGRAHQNLVDGNAGFGNSVVRVAAR